MALHSYIHTKTINNHIGDGNIEKTEMNSSENIFYDRKIAN